MKTITKVKPLLLAALAAVWMVLLGGEPLYGQASGRTVSIDSCLISGGEVVCQLTASSVPSGDDGMYYVISNEVYQDGPVGVVAGSAPAGSRAEVRFPLNYNTPQSHLSRKFLVAVMRKGELIQVSNEHYITNPEAVAAYTSGRMQAGIKGILPDGNKLTKGELQELGVGQVIYNMPLDNICSAAGVPGALPFSYNGQTYYFNGHSIAAYDATVKHFNRLGLQVTMVILNCGTGEYSGHLVHPRAVGGECPGYALNVEDQGAVDHLKAIGAFLGQRYSGRQGCGQIDNWILGNEVNARTSWWYTNSDSLDFNVSIYVKAFRILYNELKGMNGSVRLYNSLDQEWNRKSNPGSFLSRDYLDRFNAYMLREGNIDWSLSFHPYNSPLYDPYAWNGPSMWVKNSLSSPYITMQNLDILIEYMHRPEFLNPGGEVRSISLAEIGYTSSFGTEAQEASVAYGYLKAASLPDIDAFMLFRHTDDAHEMESYLAMGLTDLAGNKKPAYEIYKALGTANEGAAKARASEIIGMNIDEMISQKILWTREGSGVVEIPQ
ncbi:MAG: hypothetical protein IJC59_02165 [Lachnospiraceae bacterium]|nr:hypothetical protein [Lachnospiraceae bacterium]